MMKYVIAGVVTVFSCVNSVVYAGEIEAVLKDSTTSSGFSVKDSSGNSIARFQGDGKVGIGTTAPGAKLDVAGDVKISAVSTEAVLGTGMQQVSNGESILWYNANLRIKTAATAAAGDRVSILSNGNVGIGTTQPSAKLQVEGSSMDFGRPGLINARVSGTDKQTVIGYCENINMFGSNHSAESGYISAFNGTTERPLMLGWGANVGIGVTNPGQKLTVAGTIESTSGGVKFPDGKTQSTAARILKGTVQVYHNNAQDASVWVNFTSGFFTSAPVCILTCKDSQSFTCGAYDASTNSFRVASRFIAGNVTAYVTYYWMAIAY